MNLLKRLSALVSRTPRPPCWRPEDVQPAIDILRTRCAELNGDRDAALDQEWHNRIAGDDALVRAYKLAIAHLLFSSGQLVSITETPMQCPRCLWFGGFAECEGDGDDSGQCPKCGTPCIDRASNAQGDSQSPGKINL